jgi:hypothetical protein
MSAFVPRPRLRFSLRRLLIVVTAAALAAYWLRPPVVSADITILGVRTKTVDGRHFLQVDCQMTNTAHNSLWYQSAAKNEPLYECRYLKGNQWKNHGYFWCGTCMSEVSELKPGESVYFEAVSFTVPDALRFGVPFSVQKSITETVCAWSEPHHVPGTADIAEN